MSKPHVSIIVPVFNAAAYLESCIGSVFNQSFQHFEVIAVNDGSTDKSAEILNGFAAKDQRLKVYHTKNRGVSAARNTGLENAVGRYIGFLDADDWLEPDMLQCMLQPFTENGVDWVICNAFQTENDKKKRRLNLQSGVKHIAPERHEVLQQLMSFRYDYANWNKLFCSSILRQQDIRFEEKMCIWEDLLFNLQYLHYVNKIAIIDKPLYTYRVTPSSLYHQKNFDRLEQFNYLYRNYMQWSVRTGNKEEQDVFRKEMARLTYFQLLKDAELIVKRKVKWFVSGWREYARELEKIDPGIFYYPASERKGLQGVKKKILANGRLTLFAFIIAVKSDFGKTLKFFSGQQSSVF